VLGELLITAGVFVLLFLGWQLWFNDSSWADSCAQESLEQSQAWAARRVDRAARNPDDPPVLGTPEQRRAFGLMIIPRFGAATTSDRRGHRHRRVLNKGEIGHYPTTQMPGDGGQLRRRRAPHQLRQAVQPARASRRRPHLRRDEDGWYQYVFRNLEYVRPDRGRRLAPVPQSDGRRTRTGIMTMTSCNPLFSAAERIIAYSVFDSFYPRADGRPRRSRRPSRESTDVRGTVASPPGPWWVRVLILLVLSRRCSSRA
jgi:sortase A